MNQLIEIEKDGRKTFVTEKAYRSIYAPRGFVLVGGELTESLNIDRGNVETEKTAITAPETCPTCGQVTRLGGVADQPRNNKKLYATAAADAVKQSGEMVTSAADIAKNLNLIGDNAGQQKKIETPLTRPVRPNSRRNFPVGVNDNGASGELIEHKTSEVLKVTDMEQLKHGATVAGMPPNSGLIGNVPTLTSDLDENALDAAETGKNDDAGKTNIDGGNLEPKRAAGKASRNAAKKRAHSRK